MDSATYGAQRERECQEVSASCDVTVAEERGADPPRAKLLGRAYLTGEAFVEMYEVLELHPDHVHRVKYAYYLFLGEEEIGGYERDPIHDPIAEHRHCGDHVSGGEPAPAVSFKEAVRIAWEWLSEHGHGSPETL